MQICPNCGEENPPRFRLCGFCGTALAPAAPAQEVRKLVTILFCDLRGSTALGERLDSESLRETMSRYFDAMSAAITQHGGTIEKFIGDAVMAVFGLPRVHEDDALRAVRAARGMQDALAGLNDGLERTYGVTLANRIGVNTGEVVAGDVTTGQRLVTGDPVNTAARLEQAAGSCEVLLGELTYRLVREHVEVEPVEPLELKGKAERVPAFRLTAVRERPREATDRAPLVGREPETARVADAVRHAAEMRSCERLLITGDAGVGKSRLVAEAARLAGERGFDWLQARCLSYGGALPYWPYVDLLRRAARLDATHEQLDSKSITFHDFVGTSTTPYDDHGHGTHVANIAAGDGVGGINAPTFRGVAPGSPLFIGKVLDSAGSGSDSAIIAGIQWCAGQAAVRVISMSIGTVEASDGQDALSQAHDEIRRICAASWDSDRRPR